MVLVLDQFIRNLRDSRLIPVEELASLQKALQGSKTPHTVEDVAKLLIQSGKLTEFQAAAISQGQPQSLILGEYVLLNILGKGGMGVVYRARHRLMDRVVALKTLPPATIKPDSVQRFYREVKAAARLSHPNIVTAFDAGEHAGTHYLVMEYVVGRDLSAIVKQKGPLPLRQAIDYVAAGGPRTGVRPRAWRRPPRRQAEQPVVEPGGRGQDPRHGSCPAEREPGRRPRGHGTDRDRPDPGNGRLHVAGTGRGRPFGRPSFGHLQSGLHAVLLADAPGGIRGRDDREADPGPSRRADPVSDGDPPRLP